MISQKSRGVDQMIENVQRVSSDLRATSEFIASRAEKRQEEQKQRGIHDQAVVEKMLRKARMKEAFEMDPATKRQQRLKASMESKMMPTNRGKKR